VAYLEDREPRRTSAFAQAAVHPFFDLGAQFSCDFLSVEEACAHDY